MNTMMTIDGAKTLELHNVTMNNGVSNAQGGAVFVWNNSTLGVYDSIFSNNTAQVAGGAIYGQVSTIHIERSIFTNNLGIGSGGAIYTLGTTSSYGQLTGSCNNFNGNITQGTSGTFYGSGGAIYVSLVNTMMNGGAFQNNTAVNTTGIGNHIYRFPFGSNSVDATGNYWTNPTVPSGFSISINAGNQLSAQPNCPMNAPKPIPSNVIVVDQQSCLLADAITMANNAGVPPTGSSCTLSSLDTNYVSNYVIEIQPTEVVVTSAPDGINGLPVVNGNLVIRGTDGAARTIRRDASAPSFRLLNVAAGGSLILTGVTVRGGNIDGNGGGIYNSGRLIVDNTSIEQNAASGNGGGIYNSGSMSIDHSIISNNQAAQGGAVYVASNPAIDTVNTSCIIGNSSTAIFAESGITFVAQQNWWGTIDGPSGSGTGSGDAVGANINFSGYLQAPPLNMPSLCLGINASPAPNHSLLDGSEIIYQLTVANNSPNPITVNNVQFTYQEGSELTFSSSIPARGGGAYPPLNWSLNPSTLTPGSNASIEIHFNIDSSGDIPTSALVTMSDGTVLSVNHFLNVPITNIVFDNKLKAAMFWAIFNETSEDKYFSGNSDDVLNSFYDSHDSRTFVQFLNTDPYCAATTDPLGGNNAPGEQLGGNTGWDADIIAITHCNPPDHRLFYAESIINNFIIDERKTGTQTIMGYLLYHNFGGSLADPQAPIWGGNNPPYCTSQFGASLPYANYDEAYKQSNANNSYQPAIDWLYAYLQCQLDNTASDPAAVNRRAIFASAYTNIMREIDNATANLADDPTGGVTTTVQANNGNGTASEFVVGVANGVNATQADVTDAYNTEVTTLRDGNGSSNNQNGYGPSLTTILRPALFADLQRPKNDPVHYVLTGYAWVTFSFQRPNPPFKR